MGRAKHAQTTSLVMLLHHSNNYFVKVIELFLSHETLNLYVLTHRLSLPNISFTHTNLHVKPQTNSGMETTLPQSNIGIKDLTSIGLKLET